MTALLTFYSHRDDPSTPGLTGKLFSVYYGLQQVHTPDEADIIIWNGGEDIGTSIYGEQPQMNGIPHKPSARDLEEIAMFNKFKGRPHQLLLGICRGSQLLNCLNGGKLYQDVNNHGGTHEMVDLDTKEVLKVTSTHHQQMRPNPKEGHVIGVSSESTRKLSGANGIENFKPWHFGHREGVDVEIVWYPKTHTLCIQGHPEYTPISRFATYTRDLITKCWDDQCAV